MRDDELIDAAISDQARALTSGEPSPQLRVRVAERIAAGRWSVVGGWWLVVGGAVATLLVVAVLLWPREVPTAVNQPAPVLPPQAIRVEPPQSVPPPARQEAGRERARPTTERMPGPAAIALADVVPIVLPAVAGFDPIEIGMIEEPGMVELPMIVVDMIDMAPAQIQQ